MELIPFQEAHEAIREHEGVTVDLWWHSTAR
jgi:hypothetical protein